MKRLTTWIIVLICACSVGYAKTLDWSQVKVGLTMTSDSIEYMTEFKRGLKDAVESRGGQVVEGIVGGEALDIRGSLEAMILQGCDVIVDFHQKPEVYAKGYARRLLDDYNVPVIEIDQVMDAPIYFVGGDQYAQGLCQANYVADWIEVNWAGALDYCVLFYLKNNGEAAWERQRASESVMRKRLGLREDQIIWIDISSGDDHIGEAVQKTRDFLVANAGSKIYLVAHADFQAIAMCHTENTL